MAMVFTSSIQEILMLVNGVMDKAMVLDHNLALMVAVTLVNSNAQSNMASDVTISGIKRKTRDRYSWC